MRIQFPNDLIVDRDTHIVMLYKSIVSIQTLRYVSMEVLKRPRPLGKKQ